MNDTPTDSHEKESAAYPAKNIEPKTYDLLVVGAGIYGCWTAYHAVQRGLKVLLVDGGDIGCGTSMSSSKLIHGGLRYLETGDLRLVRKSLKERQVLYELFPHLVKPMRFRVPLGDGCRWSPLKLKAGLWLYDMLAFGCKDFPKHRFDDAKEQTDGLSSTTLRRGSYQYSDGQTDDARLCFSIVEKMLEQGGELLTYHRVSNVNKVTHGGYSAILTDTLSKPKETKTQKCCAKQVFYATGARLSEKQELSGALLKTRGLHLVFKKKFDHGAVLLHSPVDGRVFFMLPWYGRTMIGTTDIEVDASEQNADCSAEEIQYLYDSINPYLSTPFTASDLHGAYAGLRVMRKHDTQAGDNTRDWKAVQLKNGTWVSLGGKITSARQDTESWVSDQYGASFEKNIAGIVKGDTKIEGNSPPLDAYFYSRYGEHWRRLTAMAKQYPHELSKIHSDLPFLWLEIRYVARHEHVKTLEDILRRRIPLMILMKIDDDTLSRVLEIVQEELEWSDEKKDCESVRFVKGQFNSMSNPQRSLGWPAP